jgi:uncharacterized protein involved in exopolysaccharide biosynthesis
MNLNETAHDYLLWFFHVLFKRQRLITLCMTVSFALVCMYTFTVTPTFMASSQVLVKIGRENVYVPQGGNYNPILSENSLEQINSEIELLKSRVLAERIINSIGTDRLYPDMGDPVWYKRIKSRVIGSENTPIAQLSLGKFDKALTIHGIKNSRVIEVGFQHPDPVLAAEVANRYVAGYLDERVKVHQDPKTLTFFDDQTKFLREKIQKTEEKLRELKSRSELVELSQERSLLLRQRSELEVSMNDTEGRVEETLRRIAQLRQQTSVVPERIPQGEETESNPLLINTLQGQLVQLELRKKELLSKYTEGNRFVQEVDEQIRGVQKRLSDEEPRRYGRSRYGPNPSFQQIRDDLLRNEVELKALNAKLHSQRDHMERYRKRLDQIASNEIIFNDLQSELDVDRKNYQLYLTKAEESRISNEMDSQKIVSVSVLRPALIPLKPIKPNILLNLGLGIAFAVFGSLGLAFGLDLFRDHFDRPDEVEAALGTPVLASIPHLQK